MPPTRGRARWTVLCPRGSSYPTREGGIELCCLRSSRCQRTLLPDPCWPAQGAEAEGRWPHRTPLTPCLTATGICAQDLRLAPPGSPSRSTRCQAGTSPGELSAEPSLLPRAGRAERPRPRPLGSAPSCFPASRSPLLSSCRRLRKCSRSEPGQEAWGRSPGIRTATMGASGTRERPGHPGSKTSRALDAERRERQTRKDRHLEDEAERRVGGAGRRQKKTAIR